MKISLNEIIKLVPEAGKVPAGELVKLIGARLVEVEGAEDLSEKYKGIYIVRVAECEKIPETHLSLCQVDCGKDELVQVVCGALNVRKGMMAVWIAPGAIVPETFGEENFKLSVRKLRGYESNGMLAALDELALGEGHEGIVEIDPKMAKAGDVFAEVFGLNDIILDIENKSLTHRPDCFGIIGFSREVSGILGKKFEEPSWEVEAPVAKSSDTGVVIKIQSPEICERYSCAVIELDGAIEKNKYLTLDDIFLAKAGMRGISRIVDVTNILMLQTGQPLHAFDYDKFLKVGGGKKAKVGVRTAKNGEELQLIDGKTVLCDENDILITSGDVPVALAGAMGGANTEIDASTKRVLLESATFSLYHLRKTQMKHGIFSEAITRFTKGQPAGNTVPVLLSACAILSRGASLAPVVTGLARSCSVVTSASPSKEGALQKGALVEYYVEPEKIPLSGEPVCVAVEQINGLLGTEYNVDECRETLENVGFGVEVGKGELLTVTVPYWRTDIHIPEDVTEEVGRLKGFDNIPKTLAMRPFVGAKIDEVFKLKKSLREIVSQRLWAHEVLTYSFVSRSLQEKVLEDPETSYEIVNSISPELQVFRQTVVPSLLEKTYENLRAGQKDFALFEMNQVTNKKLGLDEDGVPIVENHFGMVVSDGGYYAVKAKVLAALRELGIFGEVEEVKVKDKAPAYFEEGRSAKVVVNGKILGYIGEFKGKVRRVLKLPKEVAGAELSLDRILEILQGGIKQKNVMVSKFPTVERDITVKVPEVVEFGRVEETIVGALEKVVKDDRGETVITYRLEPKSIYKKLNDTKNLSFHLEFSHLKKTLTAEEIREIIKRVEKSLVKVKGEVI